MGYFKEQLIEIMNEVESVQYQLGWIKESAMVDLVRAHLGYEADADAILSHYREMHNFVDDCCY